MPAFTANLTNIVQYNPDIDLPDRQIKLANASTLVLVGIGSIHAQGPVIGLPGRPLTKKGCIESLRFGKGSEDLTHVFMNGTAYSGGNINDFRDVLHDAAVHGKCINFCWNFETNEMSMLNVYPQCCCRCDQNVD